MSGPVRIIQEAVAREFDVPLEALTGERKMPEVARPRHVAIWLAYELLPELSGAEIARGFNKHYRSIVHSLEMFKAMRARDLAFDTRAMALRRALDEALRNREGGACALCGQRVPPARSGIAAALTVAASLLFAAPAAAQHPSCWPIKRLAADLAERHGERPAATGVSLGGEMVFELYVRDDGASWTLVAVRRGIGCIAAAGTDWQGKAIPDVAPLGKGT